MSEMIDLTPRDYEVSVWTLQDSYKATLKWSGIDHQGQIMAPKMSISDDGTETFSFSIPMYLNVKKGNQVVKAENPMWYTVKDNELLLQNMRKIKVILDKGKADREKVYEFIIVKVKDSHEDDKLQCDVECEGLAFHELGKQGFKIELSSEVFYDRLKKYTEGKKWYDNNYIEHSDEPVETIAYWMNDLDIQPVASASSRFVSKWYYDVRMRYDNSGAISNQIMEDAYISAWNDDLSPKTVEPRAEKKRLIDAKESNKYNLTQTIAEKFGVFCRYEYTHDANYCITGRTVVFYNDFLRDENGFSELTYPHSSLKIEREHDATDITTKMFVRPEEDTSSLTGQISIIDTEANMTKEDYIMNFDYFHNIKTISDDQYEALTSYNQQIHDINCGTGQEEGLISLQEQLIARKEKKIEVDAQLKVAENSIDEAERRLGDVQKQISELNIINTVPITQPKKYMVLTDDNDMNYINLGTANREIIFDSIRIYHTWDSQAAAVSGATEADAFPDFKVSSFPKAHPLTFNGSASATKNAIRLYRKVYKHINHNEITYDSASTTIQGFFTTVNSSTGIRIPSTYNSGAFNENVLVGDGGLNYSVLEDDIGWVLTAMGYATIDKLYEGSNNYVVKKIKLWGSNASSAELSGSIDANDGNVYKITQNSWNTLVTYRKDWMLAVANNINRSEIDTSNARITYNSSAGKWIKTPSGGSVSVTVQKSSGTYGLRWTYSESSAGGPIACWGTDIETLWTDNKTTWEDDLNISSYYDMLESKFGLIATPNKVISFSAKRDSNNSLIALVNLPASEKDKAVYLLYDWEPNLYWEQIKQIWTKKHKLAETEQLAYKQEQEDLEAEIETLETRINELLQRKHQIIEQFNSLMGPALRESYWQPEDYHNYGDLHQPENFSFTLDNSNPASTPPKNEATLIWDDNVLTGEQKLSYGYGVNNTVYYYECLNLNKIITNLLGQTSTLYAHLNDLVFSFYDDNFDKEIDGEVEYPVYWDSENAPVHSWYQKQIYDYGVDENSKGKCIREIPVTRKEASRKYYHINSDMFFGYAKNANSSTILPVLILTGLNELPNDTINFIMQKSDLTPKDPNSGDPYRIRPGAEPQLGYFENGTFQTVYAIKKADWLVSRKVTTSNYTAVYPRFEINSLQLKTYYTILSAFTTRSSIQYQILLSEYNDFTLFNRGSSYFITLKPEAFLTERKLAENITTNLFTCLQNNNLQLKLTYMISNGGTYIYLDAQKVLKENSIPKVAYIVQPNFNNQAYKKYDLGQIIMINDYELKLHNVFGYISQITMDLDHYWQDEITVKDYKNKFEDLFSTITAQVEEMKKNNGIISGISAGILPMGLASSILNLEDGTAQYRLSSIIDAYLDSHFDGREVVEQELNEIFKEAADILSDGSLALTELGALNEENANILSTLLSQAAEARDIKVFYVETDDPNDGSVTGYNVGDICITPSGSRYTAIAEPENTTSTHFMPTYDGNVSKITGASMEIDADKGYIDLKAENEINIASGKNLYIAAGSDISMVGNKVVNIAGPTINICSTSEYIPTSQDEYGNFIYGHTENTYGGVNIIAQVYDLENPTNTTQSGVYIKYNLINMISADIKMTAVDNNDSTKGSTMYISGTDGIWLGTNNGAGIRLYSAPSNSSSIDGITVNQGNPFTAGTSLELLPNKVFFGTLTSQGYGSAIYMDPAKMILSTGNSNIFSNMHVTGSGGLIGVELTQNSIGFATYNGGVFSAILMNHDGVTIGAGSGFDATGTNTQLDEMVANAQQSNTEGSYVRISSNGIRLGSTSNLYINTDNFKIQTNDGHTRFAVGNSLHNLNNLTLTSTDMAGGSSFKGLVYNDGTLQISGEITASAFIASGNNRMLISEGVYWDSHYTFIADGEHMGFYNIGSNPYTPILTIRPNFVTGAATVQAYGDLAIQAGGNFSVSSTNFNVNTQTNEVSITGTINANAGTFTGNIDVGSATIGGNINIGKNDTLSGEAIDGFVEAVSSALNIYNGNLRLHYNDGSDAYVRLGVRYSQASDEETGLYYAAGTIIEDGVTKYVYKDAKKRVYQLQLMARGWVARDPNNNGQFAGSGASKVLATFTRKQYIAINTHKRTTQRDASELCPYPENYWEETTSS